MKMAINRTSDHIPCSATQLMSRAQEMTGLTDIIDTDIEETLEKFLHSLNTEADLHAAGAAAMQRHLQLVLCNRLRMLRDFRAHPEISEQHILPPLIINGGGRTGSTKLHKMLAVSGDFNWIPCWQGASLSLQTGDRNEDPALRIREADEHIRWFNDHAPNARAIHEFSTFEPEEENLLLAQRLFAPYMIAFVFVPTFIQWYVTQRDLHDDFKFLRQTLQYLQWQFHDGKPRPWILKNPLYPGMEPLLAEVFPDAPFVCTHREPVSVMSSSLSLITNYHIAYSDVDHMPMIAPMMLEGQAAAREQQITVRDNHPELRWLDISYADITQHAETAVERVYAHAGMSCSDDAKQMMRTWESENSQHKLGAHKHRLQEFGLSPETVKRRFGSYIARHEKDF
jgi:Sulfotransferase family